MVSVACAKPRSTVQALKKDLTKAWNGLPMKIVARAVDDFPSRLKKSMKQMVAILSIPNW